MEKSDFGKRNNKANRYKMLKMFRKKNGLILIERDYVAKVYIRKDMQKKPLFSLTMSGRCLKRALWDQDKVI